MKLLSRAPSVGMWTDRKRTYALCMKCCSFENLTVIDVW